MPDQIERKIARRLDDKIESPISTETRLLAAIAYGEASVDDNSDEVLGIAYAVSNRARAWGKTVPEVLKADPNYTYAANGHNVRFNLLQEASLKKINDSVPLRQAVNAAINALNQTGSDPSNGAYWWDGVDLKLKKDVNPRIAKGFKYGAQEHNIYQMEQITKTIIQYWRVIDKKTKKIVNGAERGRFDSVYISKAACGQTIFWRYNPDFVSATGAKEYR